MPVSHMDVEYVRASSFREMTKTPGELLSEELEARGITRTKFAEMLGVKYATVLRWCENRGGFNASKRRQAALQLQLPASHFDAPTVTEQHDRLCRKALEAFLATNPAPPVSEAELNSLAGFKPPIDKEPEAIFYAGALNLVRNLHPSESFKRELAENEALRRSLTRKLEKSGETEEQLRQKGRRVPDKKGKRKTR